MAREKKPKNAQPLTTAQRLSSIVKSCRTINVIVVLHVVGEASGFSETTIEGAIGRVNEYW